MVDTEQAVVQSIARLVVHLTNLCIVVLLACTYCEGVANEHKLESENFSQLTKIIISGERYDHLN